MGIYRVTEVTEVEADSEQEAIEKVAGNLEGEVVSQSADRHPERAPDAHGCPQCGRTDFIEVVATAIGTVPIGLDGPHVDEVTWGALRDADIMDARSFTCHGCQHREDVDGDKGLYDALNLRWD